MIVEDIFYEKIHKKIYLVFLFSMIISMCLGNAYLSSTLIINGKSNITKNILDVHFDNINKGE